MSFRVLFVYTHPSPRGHGVDKTAKCGGTMKIIAFLTDHAVVDRIIDHLKLTFVADKPPPAHLAYQELIMAAETSAEYFS
jgi:hypothetical protein